jgi:hypothetical protein
MTISRRHGLAAALAGLFAPMGHAQDWSPGGRPLRMVVPFPPGGSTDILARAIGPKLAASLGTQVLVDNKPGAGGSLGAAEVARAEPDGHTLLMGHIGTLAVNPAIYPRLAYDPLRASSRWPGSRACPTCWWCPPLRPHAVSLHSSTRCARDRAATAIPRAAMAARRTSPSSTSSSRRGCSCCTSPIEARLHRSPTSSAARSTRPSRVRLPCCRMCAAAACGRSRSAAGSALQPCPRYPRWRKAASPDSSPTSGTAWWPRPARQRPWWRSSTPRSTRHWRCQTWRNSWPSKGRRPCRRHPRPLPN